MDAAIAVFDYPSDEEPEYFSAHSSATAPLAEASPDGGYPSDEEWGYISPWHTGASANHPVTGSGFAEPGGAAIGMGAQRLPFGTKRAHQHPSREVSRAPPSSNGLLATPISIPPESIVPMSRIATAVPRERKRRRLTPNPTFEEFCSLLPRGWVQFFNAKTNKDMLLIPLYDKMGLIATFFRMAVEDWPKVGNAGFSRNIVDNGTYVLTYRTINGIFSQKSLSHVIVGFSPARGNVVDHIDNNTLNYDFENLRELSPPENARNQRKRPNTTSRYPNVSWESSHRTWKLKLESPKHGISIVRFYKLEEWATWDRELCLKEHHDAFVGAKRIDIVEPPNFVRAHPKRRISEEARLAMKQHRADKLRTAIATHTMVLDSRGRAIVPSSNSTDPIFVSPAMWSTIMFGGPWSISVDRRNGRKDATHGAMLMARLVLGLSPGDIRQADHVNGNTLDNTIENLRIIGPGELAIQHHNQRKHTGSANKYSGVFQRKLRNGIQWGARITRGGHTYVIHGFVEEMQAARMRDSLAIALYGEHAKVHFPDDPLLLLPPKTLAEIRRYVRDGDNFEFRTDARDEDSGEPQRKRIAASP